MEPEPLNQGRTLNLDDTVAADVAVDTPVWQRSGRVFADSATSRDKRDFLTKEFLRKYIHYAKNRIHPVLSEEAMQSISAAYAVLIFPTVAAIALTYIHRSSLSPVNHHSTCQAMRSKQSQRNLPVTARTLETIIRLSSANAKARLSLSVDNCDVEVAVELINFVVFHEAGLAAPEEPAGMLPFAFLLVQNEYE